MKASALDSSYSEHKRRKMACSAYAIGETEQSVETIALAIASKTLQLTGKVSYREPTFLRGS